jgi:galactose-1-phosphate uridylyltransferase
VGAYHPVIALSKAHFLKLAEFRPQLLADGFLVARNFLLEVFQRDPSIVVSTVNANYLLPAGASLVHPHMQMLAAPTAYSYHARLLAASDAYLRTQGSCYYTDLISKERLDASRYIARKGKWHWIASFSPLGSNEIMGIHEDSGDFGSLDNRDLEDLGSGISSTLATFEDLGHLSFNFSLFSAREHEGFRCMIKIVTRQNLCANYRNDDYFLQKMLQSELIINLPEDLAAGARRRFQG